MDRRPPFRGAGSGRGSRSPRAGGRPRARGARGRTLEGARPSPTPPPVAPARRRAHGPAAVDALNLSGEKAVSLPPPGRPFRAEGHDVEGSPFDGETSSHFVRGPPRNDQTSCPGVLSLDDRYRDDGSDFADGPERQDLLRLSSAHPTTITSVDPLDSEWLAGPRDPGPDLNPNVGRELDSRVRGGSSNGDDLRDLDAPFRPRLETVCPTADLTARGPSHAARPVPANGIRPENAVGRFRTAVLAPQGRRVEWMRSPGGVRPRRYLGRLLSSHLLLGEFLERMTLPTTCLRGTAGNRIDR